MKQKVIRVFIPYGEHIKISEYTCEVGTENEAQLYSVVDTSLGMGLVIDPDYHHEEEHNYNILPIYGFSNKRLAASFKREWMKAIPVLAECYLKYSGNSVS